MPIDVDNEAHAKEIGQLQSEVHTLNTLVTKLFEKFDLFVEKSQPKPMGAAGYIGIAVSVMTMGALLFGSVMYITSSSNAPLVAQMSQVSQVLSTIQSNTMRNANHGQLLSKELSAIDKSVASNETTLDWIIYQENLPKQVTEAQGRLNTLEMQVNRIVNNMHKGK